MDERNFGGPDWGLDGKKRCYECDAPVDDNLHSCTKYQGPIAEAFAECDGCGAPRFDWVGTCPKCRGLVFEFKDKFACFNETLGLCNFSLTTKYLIEMDVIPTRAVLGHLLDGPVEINVFDCSQGNEKGSFTQEIAFDEDKGWYIKETDKD